MQTQTLTYKQINTACNCLNLKYKPENHYYPFGLKHPSYESKIFTQPCKYCSVPAIRATDNPDYKYKYNGKEYQDELGLNVYDMDMRQYDPAIARWTVQDPVVHHSMSPYNAFDNNPVFWADPSGADSWSYIWGSNGLYRNNDTGEESDDYQRAIDETVAGNGGNDYLRFSNIKGEYSMLVVNVLTQAYLGLGKEKMEYKERISEMKRNRELRGQDDLIKGEPDANSISFCNAIYYDYDESHGLLYRGFSKNVRHVINGFSFIMHYNYGKIPYNVTGEISLYNRTPNDIVRWGVTDPKMPQANMKDYYDLLGGNKYSNILLRTSAGELAGRLTFGTRKNSAEMNNGMLKDVMGFINTAATLEANKLIMEKYGY